MRILSNLDVTRLRHLEDDSPEGKAHLWAGHATKVLRLSLGPSDGAYTLATENGDVLVARWPTLGADDGGGRLDYGIWVWDQPWAKTLVIELNPLLLTDDAKIAGYCTKLFEWDDRWRRALSLSRQTSEDKRTLINGRFELHQRSNGMLPADLWLQALNDGTKAYIVVSISGGTTLMERFPLFRERIASYSKQRLLTELGKGLPPRVFAYPQERDAIIIRELISRGDLDDAEVIKLLEGNTDRSKWWFAAGISARMDVFQNAIADRGDFTRYAPVLMRFVLESPAPSSPGGDDNLVNLFGLIERHGVDATDWALGLLRQRRCEWSSLSYLERRAGSPEIVRTLSGMSMQGNDEAKRIAVVAKLKRRLSEAKRE